MKQNEVTRKGMQTEGKDVQRVCDAQSILLREGMGGIPGNFQMTYGLAKQGRADRRDK